MRVVIRYILLGVVFLSSGVVLGQQHLNEQRLKVVLRQIGHDFLLQLGDSSSRVLPIKKEGDRYKIAFEESYGFQPDLLVYSTKKVFDANQINVNYIVEVEECLTHDVVYSYENKVLTSDDLVACKSRPLPADCYSIYLTFYGVTIEAEPELNVTTAGANPVLVYVLISAVVILLLGVLIYRKSKSQPLRGTQIGKYRFDEKRMKLFIADREEVLSAKEADLLILLVENLNETVERETILREVWKDNGDYVGRTLDVSISKLRKKLQEDENIKIINSRGVGYRLLLD